MPLINVAGVKSLSNKIYWETAHDAHKRTELYEQTGFWLIFHIFRYFSFRLQENPHSHSCLNRCHASFIVSFTLIAFAVTCYLTSNLVWKSNGSMDIENVSYFALTSFGYFLTILNFSISLAKARKYSSFLRSVSSAVNLIPNLHSKQKTVLSIRRSSYICLIFILIGILIAIIPTLYQTQLWGEEDSKQLPPITSIFLVISSVLNFIWIATIANFYLFCNAFLFLVCKVLSDLIDIYLVPENREENLVDDAWMEAEEKSDEGMNENLANHRKLSVLVKQANSIFSHLLIMSLAMEIALSISFIKLLSIKNGLFSLGAYSNIFHVMMMVGKAIACANVNDKLKSSLELKKLPSTRRFFEDQVSYILYQTDQQNNRAEITYGNVFPVTKTFIFTIAGTALTYALVLQGV